MLLLADVRQAHAANSLLGLVANYWSVQARIGVNLKIVKTLDQSCGSGSLLDLSKTGPVPAFQHRLSRGVKIQTTAMGDDIACW